MAYFTMDKDENIKKIKRRNKVSIYFQTSCFLNLTLNLTFTFTTS